MEPWELPIAEQVQATGGTGARTWSIHAGHLPPTSTINSSTGVISGTPSASGTFNFTVRSHRLLIALRYATSVDHDCESPCANHYDEITPRRHGGNCLQPDPTGFWWHWHTRLERNFRIIAIESKSRPNDRCDFWQPHVTGHFGLHGGGHRLLIALRYTKLIDHDSRCSCSTQHNNDVASEWGSRNRLQPDSPANWGHRPFHMEFHRHTTTRPQSQFRNRC